MNTKNSFRGNLFLAGEHAVVYEYPGIIMSIQKSAHAQARFIKENKIKINSELLGKAELSLDKQKNKKGNKKLFVLLDLAREFMEKYAKLRGIEIKISSELPVARGMSSSTAVLSATLFALSKLFKKDIPKEDYFKILFPYQKILHGGKASGTEFKSSLYRGFHFIKKKNDKLKAKRLKAIALEVVIGDSGIIVETSKTVGKYIPNLIEKNKKWVMNCFEKIKIIVKKERIAIKNKDIKRLGELMNENQRILKELGLSHEKIDRAIKAAINAGAYGAKLSGKGQGGIMFAITDLKHKKAVEEAISKEGLEIISTKAGV